MLRNLAFRSLLYGPFERAIRRVVEVLASRTVLKICYRSFSKYLVVEDIVNDIAKDVMGSSGAEPKVKDSFNLSILFLIGEKAQDIGVNGVLEMLQRFDSYKDIYSLKLKLFYDFRIKAILFKQADLPIRFKAFKDIKKGSI